MNSTRTFPWDWYPGTLPENVVLDDTAYVETTFSFCLYRSEAPVGVQLGRGTSTYGGTMFDVGSRGRVTLGNYVLVNGARIICDAEIEIGDYSLISWNVVLMDTYRLPLDPIERQRQLECVSRRFPRCIDGQLLARPIRIERNVWIGFDACVLPGVTIGEGAIVGARSVVTQDVPPYSVVAGNPARLIKKLDI
ncbi:MAG TPA: acyltransferase [Cyanobacteria bacterium UBA8553]|nr:acyltransferase [Cyanobacteria bacterium UBA8553]